MKAINRIDLNCDMGESDDESRIAIDCVLLESVTSVNIACGGHAGTPASMERTVWAAISQKVAVGAHPSYPDRANFGRVAMDMSIGELERCVRTQIATLASVCARTGAELTHVKPHGALYHAAATREDVANAIAGAAHDVNPSLVLVGLAGSTGLAKWKTLGCPVAAEAFADRRYEKDGSLRGRQHEDALITNHQEAVAQAMRIAVRKAVVAIDGTEVALQADTMCIHSDTPGAADHARAIRSAIEQAGVRVSSLQ